MLSTASTISPSEVKRFSSQAKEWWNPRGPFAPLHTLMPLRVRYVLSRCNSSDADTLPLKGMRVLDMACGGGLMSEALAKLGADVVGVDASASALEVAREHAEKNDLNIDYRQGTAEQLSKSGEQFDLVVAFEIVEHVNNLSLFMDALSKVLKPGGQILLSTVNRTRRGFLLGIVAAEYVMRWVPAGTHDWDRFVKPSEIVGMWAGQGIEPTDLTGLVYKPLSRKFELIQGNTAVNYFIAGLKCK